MTIAVVLVRANVVGSGSNGSPRATFEQTSLDFGKVPYNQTIDAVYPFSNTGTAPLKVQGFDVKIVKGC